MSRIPTLPLLGRAYCSSSGFVRDGIAEPQDRWGGRLTCPADVLLWKPTKEKKSTQASDSRRTRRYVADLFGYSRRLERLHL